MAFFKELFGLIGIVGGVFVGSRYANQAGSLVSDNVIALESQGAVNLTGFIVSLVLFWVAMTVVGSIFTKLSKISGLGIFDKIFGFVISGGKFFFIFAIIIYSISSSTLFQKNIEPLMKDSLVYPVLNEVGSYIVKIDFEPLQEKVESVGEEIDTKVNDIVNETVQEKIEEVQKSVEQTIENTKEQLNKE